MHMPSSRVAGALALALAVVVTARGQEIPEPTTNNPFSRVGVGELAPHAYAAQVGMGGIGVGFNDSHIASPTNPAALGALRFTSFQVGVGLDRSRLEADGVENTNLDGNLDYLSLAFPLQNSLQRVLDGIDSKWRNGMLFSLAPYSDIGYNVETFSDVEGLGEVATSTLGSGGYYRLQWGNGFAYGNRVRGGVNLSYLFGRANAQQAVEPRGGDLAGTELTRTDALRARGLEVQFGLQYDVALGQNAAGRSRKLTLGGTYALGAELNGEASRFSTNTYFLGAGGIDTVTFATELDQTVALPDRAALGVYYSDAGRIGVGVDVTRTAWSSFRNTLAPEDRLDDALGVAVGGEFVPDPKAFGQYWQLVRYRAGAYVNADPRPDVDAEAGFSLGLGMPVVRPREEVSYVNLAVNAGRYGDAEGVRQRYVRLTVGFTLTDNTWFYKRRFN